jgi:hypothetical protein
LSDIFQEVDEEVRRERLKQLWDRYGNYAIALAVVVVACVAGWRGYEWWQAKKSAEAGAAFEVAATLSSDGKHAEAADAFAKIAADSPSGYQILARFREAAEIGERDPKTAVKLYDALAADAKIGPVLQDLAAVRAALVLVDSVPFDEMRRRLEPLTASDRPFRHTAREMLALSAWRAGDIANARRWFDVITTDLQTPSGVRSRIEVLNALVAADGKG